MAINMTRARKLCTKTELELVTASAPAALKKLDAAKRKQLATGARKLLSKWRTLLRKQKRESAAGKNTLAKIELFEQVLTRLKAKPVPKVRVSSAADTRSGVPRGVRRAKTPKPKGEPAKSKTARGSKVKGAPRAKGEATPEHYTGAVGVKRPLSHVAARNKRSQGRRDVKRFRSQG